MGIIDRLLNKKEEKKEENGLEKLDKKIDNVLAEENVKVEHVENCGCPECASEEVPVADTAEELADEEIVTLPEGTVNRKAVPYVPAAKPNPIFDPDSNEKDPKTPSYL